MGKHECAWVCPGVCGCGRVFAGVRRVCGCAQVCAGVWDVFSEFLLENRVPTSADFNTFPIRIFQLSTISTLINLTKIMIVLTPFDDIF